MTNLKKLGILAINSKAKKLAAVLTIGLLASSSALAQTGGGFEGLLNGTLSTQMGAGADFMSAIAYLAGIGFGIKAALKLKEWNDSKGREVTLTQALIPLVIAGMLLGLPSILKVAKDTTTGSGTGGTGLTNNSAIRTIN